MNLIGVADQIGEDLAQAVGIADEAVRNVRAHVDQQLELLLVRPQRQRPERLVEHLAQREVDGSISSLPASIFEKSRMSLMMTSSASADWRTVCR